MIKLKVTTNATRAQLLFAALAGRLTDQSPVLGGKVYRLTVGMIREHITSEGRAFGRPYRPLALSTIREKIRLGYGDKGILRRTDRLLDSATKRGHAEHVKNVTKTSLEVATNNPYAKYHQPDRQVIPDPPPTVFIDQVREALRDFIVTGRGA